MAFETTNAPVKPQFEGEIVKFRCHTGAVLYDIAKRHPKYLHLEWWALNDPTETQTNAAKWAKGAAND